MLKSILCSALLFIPILSFSQLTKERDVVGSAGQTSSASGVSLSWTVGEVAVSHSQSGNLIVTAGFQQADNWTSGLDETDLISQIEVYPNPVADLLNYNVNTDSPMRLSGGLYNLKGELVEVIDPFNVESEYHGELDMSSLPAGKWILRFQTLDGTLHQTFNIIKVE